MKGSYCWSGQASQTVSSELPKLILSTMFSVDPEQEHSQSRSNNLPHPQGDPVHSLIATSEATPLLGHTPLARETIESLTQQPPISNPDPCSTFTLRGLTIGLVLGTIICFINIYFGLKTGRVTGFPLAIAYIANNIARQFGPPLSVPENVFVVAVATAMAAMPMTAALVGVVPALEYLVGPEDGGPLKVSWFCLLIWSAGVCVFGPILAMACSRYFLIFKDLPFPPGTATAILIERIHAKATSRNVFTQSRFEERGDRETDSSSMVSEPSESNPLVHQRSTASRAFKVSIVVSGAWVSISVFSIFSPRRLIKFFESQDARGTSCTDGHLSIWPYSFGKLAMECTVLCRIRWSGSDHWSQGCILHAPWCYDTDAIVFMDLNENELAT